MDKLDTILEKLGEMQLDINTIKNDINIIKMILIYQKRMMKC